MSESSPSAPQSTAQIQLRLRELATLLRESAHLNPETQKSLASLLEELGAELDSSSAIPAKTARLAEAVGDVARSLHEQHHTSLLETARDRLKEAAAHAETEAPVATGVVYRLIETLSSLGI